MSKTMCVSLTTVRFTYNGIPEQETCIIKNILRNFIICHVCELTFVLVIFKKMTNIIMLQPTDQTSYHFLVALTAGLDHQL